MMQETYEVEGYTIIVDRHETEDDMYFTHHVMLPNGETHMLDTCRQVYDRDIMAFTSFYKEHGRFPTRKDHPTNKVGGLNAKRILEIK
jgi:hypothetical protein